MSYVGSDFSPTQPGTQLSYTMDFVNQIGIIAGISASVGGTLTAGDLVGIGFTSTALQDGSVSVIYQVKSGDTTLGIAAILSAFINGSNELQQIGVSSTVTSSLITIAYPPLPGITFDAILAPTSGNQFATETILFSDAPFSGETITSFSCLVESFEGVIDPAPSSRILSAGNASGSLVSFVLGNFIAGATYRVTFTAVTAFQPAILLYSHIACALPE